MTSEIFSNKKVFLSICNHSANCDICQTTKQNIQNGDVEFLLLAHEAVKESGVYNFEGCRIPINTKLIIQYIISDECWLITKTIKIVIVWNLFSFGAILVMI